MCSWVSIFLFDWASVLVLVAAGIQIKLISHPTAFVFNDRSWTNKTEHYLQKTLYVTLSFPHSRIIIMLPISVNCRYLWLTRIWHRFHLNISLFCINDSLSNASTNMCHIFLKSLFPCTFLFLCFHNFLHWHKHFCCLSSIGIGY
jgi:hypothetical protein